MYQLTPEQIQERRLAQDELKIQRKRVRRCASAIGFFLLLFVLYDLGFPYLVNYVLEFPDVKETLRAVMTNNVFGSLMQIIYTSVGMGLTVIIGMLCLRMPVRVITPVQHTPVSVMLPFMLFGIGVSRLANQAASQIGIFVEIIGLSQKYGDFTMGDNMAEIALATFSISVIPAVFEELLFRGLVLQGIRRVTSDSFAIFFSAIFFGIFHGNIIQMPFAFLLGLYFGWMTVYTNSIIPAMLMHFINNFLSCLMSTFSENFPGYDLTITMIYLIFIIIAMIISLPSLAKLSRRDKNMFHIAPNSTILPTKQMWKSSICNVGIIIVFISYGIQTLLLLFQDYI